jgi:hypothetical protein
MSEEAQRKIGSLSNDRALLLERCRWVVRVGLDVVSRAEFALGSKLERDVADAINSDSAARLACLRSLVSQAHLTRPRNQVQLVELSREELRR